MSQWGDNDNDSSLTIIFPLILQWSYGDFGVFDQVLRRRFPRIRISSQPVAGVYSSGRRPRLPPQRRRHQNNQKSHLHTQTDTFWQKKTANYEKFLKIHWKDQTIFVH